MNHVVIRAVKKMAGIGRESRDDDCCVAKVEVAGTMKFVGREKCRSIPGHTDPSGGVLECIFPATQRQDTRAVESDPIGVHL